MDEYTERFVWMITQHCNGDFCQFMRSHELEDDIVAIQMILQRYFKLPYKQREQLEKKIYWELHRNKGFRSLPQFCIVVKKPKPKRKKTVRKAVKLEAGEVA